MLIVGIDIGKRNHEATIIDQKGSIIGKAFRFANSISGFNRLMETVKRTADNDVVFGMEATGHYWLALYTHLRKKGFAVHVINAIQSDALRAMYIRQQKNDSRDSFIVANVIRFGRFCETSVAPPDLHALRELCRHRFYAVDSISSIKRKLIALLDQVFPEYESLFADTFGKASLELLSEYTTPEEILNVDTEKLVETINIAGHGRLGFDKAAEVRNAARNSFGILLAADTMALLIRQYIEQIRFIEKQIDVLNTEIARLLSTFETQLTTITGVGPTLAAVILSEIGDVKRFNSAAKLAAFAGVDPTMKQSGNFTGSRNRMSKRGSPYLRRALRLAATVASFKDPSISDFYQRKRTEGKSHMIALGHVVRKMVNIIFAVLRDNSPYSPAITI
jgi:transposase